MNPDLTGLDVREALEATASKPSGYTFNSTSVHPNGTWNFEVGYGRVNAYDAIQYVLSQSTSNSTTAFYQKLQLNSYQTPNQYKLALYEETNPGIKEARELPLTGKKSITVYNLNGQRVLESKTGEIDLNSLNTGYYILKGEADQIPFTTLKIYKK